MDYGSDPLREDTLVFIREVASMLDAHRRAGEFGELVVFASPHALGLIRSELPQALSDCIVREVAKNLVPLSPAQLAERVKQELETP